MGYRAGVLALPAPGTGLSGAGRALPAATTALAPARTALPPAPAGLAAAALLAVLLGGPAACAGPPEGSTAGAREPPVTRPPAQSPLRAMTFNIRYGTAPDGEHAWPQRRALVFRVIDDYAPHVLGVQEALRFQLDELGSELTGYGELGVGRDDGAESGEYAAILFDRGRLGLLEEGTFWLSDTPRVPGSTSWGNRIPRIATWGRFRDRATGTRFYVFNTHWDHESQPSRERSARLLLERIGARGAPEPVLLMGDFNAGEDDPAIRRLLGAGDLPDGPRLYDTFRAVHREADRTGTYHAFRGEARGPRIDAVFASREWRTLDAAIVRFLEDGRYPSDHYPVTATVVLRRAAERPASRAQPPPPPVPGGPPSSRPAP